jgi:hypothetical protein
MGWTARVRFSELAKLLSSSQRPYRLWGPPSVLYNEYEVGGGGIFPGVKRPGREAGHSPPSNAEVKNGGTIPLLPHKSSWHSA